MEVLNDKKRERFEVLDKKFEQTCGKEYNGYDGTYAAILLGNLLDELEAGGMEIDYDEISYELADVLKAAKLLTNVYRSLQRRYEDSKDEEDFVR